MRLKGLLRRLFERRYAKNVPPSRRLPHLEPVRYLKALNGYVGLWVAVKDGKIKASARTSTELAETLLPHQSVG